MAINPNTPMLVGVGQTLNRIETLDEALEPIELMMEATRRAAADAHIDAAAIANVQSVRVIRGIWGYENPAALLRERIGANGAQTVGTLIGGNQNQAVINRTALEILEGEVDFVLIAGAENGYSANKARRAGAQLPETPAPGRYDVLIGEPQQPEHHEHEVAKDIRRAIQVYPMYDNAIRHQRGETIEAHRRRVSELWAGFSDVAVSNPNAWLREGMTADAIRTPSPSNRMVGFPYTKLMNANMMVDMGAALIMCSAERAKRLGVAEAKWVYPWSGTKGYDHFSASVRHNFHTSPGIRITGARALELAATHVEDLDFVDLYSCFPSAVQVAADELGLPQDRPLTVTGGLTFGGGPLNNYVMHSIARMVELLREQPGARGFITGNGGNLYKHVHGVYSSAPPEHDFRCADVQEEIDVLPSRVCLPAWQGDARIESYTVMHNQGEPTVAHLACLTPNGERVWANCEDLGLMQAMMMEEFCGRAVRLGANGDVDVC